VGIGQSALEGLGVNRRFWNRKRVFVTGHTGFKGGWLCAWLRESGAELFGFALAPATSPSLYEEAKIADGVVSSIADIRDRDRLAAAFDSAQPEIVFHLAAQPLVRASYDRPLETFEVNAGGTAVLLDAVRRSTTARAVIVVTSDKCYAAADRRHTEDDPLGGDDPYSASKACAELTAAAYRRSFFERGPGVATARAGNVIGGGDYAEDRLLPDLMRAFGQRRSARIRRPDAVRPWQHVLDPLAGYLLLAESLHGDPVAFSGAWNFGPPADHERPVAFVADEAARAWGDGASWENDPGRHPAERSSLRLDSAKAASSLRWRARIPLAQAVEWTVRWQRALEGGAAARDLLRADIERFEGLAA
jgi:CDP-glucose 4,6-dehydratase